MASLRMRPLESAYMQLSRVADCGLFISNDKFALKTGTCPAVESMLLKKNSDETQSIILPKDFLYTNKKIITVRYRQDHKTKDLDIPLQAQN